MPLKRAPFKSPIGAQYTCKRADGDPTKIERRCAACGRSLGREPLESFTQRHGPDVEGAVLFCRACQLRREVHASTDCDWPTDPWRQAEIMQPWVVRSPS